MGDRYGTRLPTDVPVVMSRALHAPKCQAPQIGSGWIDQKDQSGSALWGTRGNGRINPHLAR